MDELTMDESKPKHGTQGERSRCAMKVRIRWMFHRDMAEVLAIEAESFGFPWQEVDFILCLRQKNCIGMVAEHDERVIGFFVYSLYKTRVQIENLAVAADCRRRGVGSQMTTKLICKLSPNRRTRLQFLVRETNLPMQLFLRSQGFLAARIKRRAFDDSNEDGIGFVYRVKQEVAI